MSLQRHCDHISSTLIKNVWVFNVSATATAI